MPATEIETKLRKCLVEAETYRGFLNQAFSLLKKHGDFSYAGFARRAGFRARSFPRDVALGEKRLSAKTLPRFIHALGLSVEEGDYLSLLVYLEEPDVSPRPILPKDIKDSLQALRKKLRAELTQAPEARYPQNLYRLAEWPYVFAALGDAETGATLDAISRRSGLPRATCRRVLEEMQAYQLVGFVPEEESFFAKSLNLYSVGLGNQASFREFFLRSLERARKVADRAFSSDDSFFFSSVFSVRRGRIPELKKRLRRVMQDFVRSSEDAEGEDLETLLLCLWPRSLDR